MINIIKSDLYRIFRGKAIYIAIIIILAMITMSCYELSPGSIGVNVGYSSSEIEESMTEEDMQSLQSDFSLANVRKVMKNYPHELDKEIVAANANLYYIFIVIIVIITSTDFSNSSIKNSISSAISRKKYYLSKLFLSLILSTGLILINNYGAYFINLLMNGSSFSSNLGEITKCTLYQLPYLYGIISVLTCICFVTKKTAIFNTVSIPLLAVFQLVLSGVIKLFNIKVPLMNYEFQTALGCLTENPTNLYLMRCVIIGGVAIILFNLIGYYSFKKTEIR